MNVIIFWKDGEGEWEEDEEEGDGDKLDSLASLSNGAGFHRGKS